MLRARWAGVATLVALVGAPAAGAGTAVSGAIAASPPATAATPVLSVRRVAYWVADTVAAQRLKAALGAVAGSAVSGAAPPQACLVVSQGGRILFSANPTAPLIPASNMKLLTATAVLDRLGPTTRLVTSVDAASAPTRGVVYGNLYLVGGGDPLLRTASYAASLSPPQPVFTSLDQLAQQVRQAGVTEVTGSIVGDDSRYDEQRTVPTWKPVYSTELDVGPLSALDVNDGFVLKPAPTKPPTTSSSTDTAARPTTSTTVPAGRTTPTTPTTSTTVAGPPPPPKLVWQSSSDPAGDSAAQFATLLRRAGVRVDGGAYAGRAPAGAAAVTSITGAPLAQEVGAMLRVSDDTAAELLLKELGLRVAGAGTTAAGVTALRADLAAHGLPVSQLVALDGSGLDRGDQVTCDLITAVLERAGPTGVIGQGLPVAGRTGTLTGRMLGTPAVGRVRAKTGSLDQVVALSGFVMPAAGKPPTPVVGQPLVFAMVVNQSPGPAAETLVDQVAVALARYPQLPPMSQLAPAG